MARRKLSVEEIVRSGNARHLSKAELDRRREEEAVAAALQRPVGLDRQSRRLWDEFYARHLPRLRSDDGGTILAWVDARRHKRKAEADAIEKDMEGRTASPETPAVIETAVPSVVAPNIAERAYVYANGMLDGTVVAGKLAKLAATRYIADLSRTDIEFSPEAAQRPADFLAKMGLVVMDWEAFILANCFGFLKNATRVRHSAYIEVAKKSGKTTFLSGLALYMGAPASCGGDGEPFPEVYVAATNRRQSSELTFRYALQLREQHRALLANSTAFKTSIVFDGHGKFEPVAARSERLNGSNIHFGILDELADHPSAELWNVFQTSTVARRQPLTIGITTSGAQREGNIAWDTRTHGIQVLEGMIQSDSEFFFIAAPDDGDIWDDERTWAKSNVSLDDVRLQNLRELCARAKSVASSKNSFLRFNLDIWPSTTEKSWIDVNDLAKAGNAYICEAERSLDPATRIKIASDRLYGHKHFGGLDLALVGDLTAYAMLFPPKDDDGVFEILFKCWVPERNIVERSATDRVPYRAWVDAGYITVTPGEVTDFKFVTRDIIELRKRFPIIELGFDSHLAEDMAQDLNNAGVKVVDVKQGFGLSPTIQRIEALVAHQKWCMHGCGLANWCFSNVALMTGTKGDYRLDKQRSRERIDLAAAACNAAYRYFCAPKPRKYVIRTIESPAWMKGPF